MNKAFLLLKKYFLQAILIFLSLLYFLSAPKTEKRFKTALLNPKHDAQKIVLGVGRQSLVLEKAGSFWLGTKECDDKKPLFFSCDSDTIRSFLSLLKKNATVVEAAGEKSLSSYGLKNGDGFFLGLYNLSGDEILSLRFGSVDSSRNIFFYVPKRKKIFSIDSEPFEPYLSVDVNFWASAEIFPKDIVGSDKKYRRGHLVFEPGAKEKPLLSTSVDWTEAREKTYDPGDGNLYRALFLPKKDGDYLFCFNAMPSAQRPSAEKDALKKINAVFNVSQWTFERVMEQE